MRDTHGCYITSFRRFSKNMLEYTNSNNNFAFSSHFSIYTAVFDIHCFFFPLVYKLPIRKKRELHSSPVTGCTWAMEYAACGLPIDWNNLLLLIAIAAQSRRALSVKATHGNFAIQIRLPTNFHIWKQWAAQ